VSILLITAGLKYRSTQCTGNSKNSFPSTTRQATEKRLVFLRNCPPDFPLLSGVQSSLAIDAPLSHLHIAASTFQRDLSIAAGNEALKALYPLLNIEVAMFRKVNIKRHQ
jgi:hypothetical protein